MAKLPDNMKSDIRGGALTVTILAPPQKAKPLTKAQQRKKLLDDDEARRPHTFTVYGGMRPTQYAVLPTFASLKKQREKYLAQEAKVIERNLRYSKRYVAKPDEKPVVPIIEYVPYGSVAEFGTGLTEGELASLAAHNSVGKLVPSDSVLTIGGHKITDALEAA